MENLADEFLSNRLLALVTNLLKHLVDVYNVLVICEYALNGLLYNFDLLEFDLVFCLFFVEQRWAFLIVFSYRFDYSELYLKLVGHLLLSHLLASDRQQYLSFLLHVQLRLQSILASVETSRMLEAFSILCQLLRFLWPKEPPLKVLRNLLELFFDVFNDSLASTHQFENLIAEVLS